VIVISAKELIAIGCCDRIEATSYWGKEMADEQPKDPFGFEVVPESAFTVRGRRTAQPDRFEEYIKRVPESGQAARMTIPLEKDEKPKHIQSDLEKAGEKVNIPVDVSVTKTRKVYQVVAIIKRKVAATPEAGGRPRSRS
jgi:hypothetical protein